MKCNRYIFRIEVFLTSVMMMIQQYNLLSSSGSDRTGFQVYLPNSSSSTFNFQIAIFLFSWIWFVCLFNNTSFSSLHASGLKIILRESMLFITFTKFWPILPQYMRHFLSFQNVEEDEMRTNCSFLNQLPVSLF